jgi:hypothetical protein
MQTVKSFRFVPGDFSLGILLVSSAFRDWELVRTLPISIIGAVVDHLPQEYSLTLCRGTAFYSEPGRQMFNKSVGRWPSSYRNPTDSQSVEPSKSARNPTCILTLGDDEPWDLYQHLNVAYPRIPKAFLVISSG